MLWTRSQCNNSIRAKASLLKTIEARGDAHARLVTATYTQPYPVTYSPKGGETYLHATDYVPTIEGNAKAMQNVVRSKFTGVKGTVDTAVRLQGAMLAGEL